MNTQYHLRGSQAVATTDAVSAQFKKTKGCIQYIMLLHATFLLFSKLDPLL